MKKVPLLTGAAVLALLVSSAIAQNSKLYFNGNSQGNKYCVGPYGCVATGFYDGSIDGVAVGPGKPGGPGMICDDFRDQIQKGENWTANGVQVSTLNSGNIAADTLFGSAIGLTGYAKLAYLVNQMFTTSLTGAQLSAYSQALWYITGGLTWSQINAAAKTLVTFAANYVKTNGNSLSHYANLWLYMPNPKGAQEMWGLVSVPEGGAALMYLLLTGVSCVGAMFFRRAGRHSHRA